MPQPLVHCLFKHLLQTPQDQKLWWRHSIVLGLVLRLRTEFFQCLDISLILDPLNAAFVPTLGFLASWRTQALSELIQTFVHSVKWSFFVYWNCIPWLGLGRSLKTWYCWYPDVFSLLIIENGTLTFNPLPPRVLQGEASNLTNFFLWSNFPLNGKSIFSISPYQFWVNPSYLSKEL